MGRDAKTESFTATLSHPVLWGTSGVPSTRRAPRSSSRERAPCRARGPEHALGHESAGSGPTLEASERVFSVPISCHVRFLLLESVLTGWWAQQEVDTYPEEVAFWIS